MTSSGLRWQIAAIFNLVQHPVLGCIDAPTLWSAAITTGPSRRRTAD
jgi:hypothetical protein